jgi:hypothetical protein
MNFVIHEILKNTGENVKPRYREALILPQTRKKVSCRKWPSSFKSISQGESMELSKPICSVEMIFAVVAA